MAELRSADDLGIPILRYYEAARSAQLLGSLKYGVDMPGKTSPAQRRIGRMRIGICVLVGACAVAVIVPSLSFFLNLWDDASRYYYMGNLRRISEAMEKYYTDHENYPPATINDPSGKPLLSWRVALLPYLGEIRLYEKFQLDQPWDSARNLDLLDVMPTVYCISEGEEARGLTHFEVFSGPGTAFEKYPMKKADFPDGADKVVFVVPAEDRVPWTKPTVLVFAPQRPMPRLYREPSSPTEFYFAEWYRRLGAGAAFGGGVVRDVLYASDPLARDESIRQYISRDGRVDRDARPDPERKGPAEMR